MENSIVFTNAEETPASEPETGDLAMPDTLKPPTDGRYHVQEAVRVGPAEANYLLSRNIKNNRNVKNVAVQRYARDMNKGLWRSETGESVKVSTDGWMIDGQNRMHAVAASGRTILIDIAWNVPTENIHVIDGGVTRSVRDDLAFNDVLADAQLGPIIRWVINWEKGNFMNKGGGYTMPTRQESMVRFRQEPQALEHAAVYGRAIRKYLRKVNASAAGMAYWLFAKIDEEKASEFFDKMISGAEMPMNSPLSTLRNGLINRAEDLTKQEQLYFFIRAWNQERRGELASGTGRLAKPKTPISNESFPMPI